MAELKIGKSGDRLQALGLGSCIGLVLVDKKTHLGGMVHIMLPHSSVSRDKNPTLAKFADTGVPLLLDEVLKAGAMRSRLIVKLAGGAEMFSFAGQNAPKLAVGARNAEAVREHLKELNLRIDREDCGGTHGRTLEVNLETLRFTVKVVGHGETEL